ncbi:hypothetical protein KIPB_003950, partial [Kipferlia bialata]|eukprot:g3950.t1
MAGDSKWLMTVLTTSQGWGEVTSIIVNHRSTPESEYVYHSTIEEPSNYDGGDNAWADRSKYLSLYGNTLVVGSKYSHYDNPGNLGSGSAYIYQYTDASDAWTLVAEIRNRDSDNTFGVVLALTETHILVGGSKLNANYYDLGRVTLYDCSAALEGSLSLSASLSTCKSVLDVVSPCDGTAGSCKFGEYKMSRDQDPSAPVTMVTTLDMGIHTSMPISAVAVSFDLDALTYSMTTLTPTMGDDLEIGALSLTSGVLAVSLQDSNDGWSSPSYNSSVQLYSLEHDTPTNTDKWTLKAEADNDICISSPVPYCGTDFGAYVTLSPPSPDGTLSVAVRTDHCTPSELVIDSSTVKDTGCVVFMDIVQLETSGASGASDASDWEFVVTDTVAVGNKHDQIHYSAYTISPSSTAPEVPTSVAVTPTAIVLGQLMIDDLSISFPREDGTKIYSKDSVVLVSMGDQTFLATPDATLSAYTVPSIMLTLETVRDALTLEIEYYVPTGVSNLVNACPTFQQSVPMPVSGGTPSAISVDPIFLGWEEDGEVNDFTVQLTNQYGALIADGREVHLGTSEDTETPMAYDADTATYSVSLLTGSDASTNTLYLTAYYSGTHYTTTQSLYFSDMITFASISPSSVQLHMPTTFHVQFTDAVGNLVGGVEKGFGTTIGWSTTDDTQRTPLVWDLETLSYVGVLVPDHDSDSDTDLDYQDWVYVEVDGPFGSIQYQQVHVHEPLEGVSTLLPDGADPTATGPVAAWDDLLFVLDPANAIVRVYRVDIDIDTSNTDGGDDITYTLLVEETLWYSSAAYNEYDTFEMVYDDASGYLAILSQDIGNLMILRVDDVEGTLTPIGSLVQTDGTEEIAAMAMAEGTLFLTCDSGVRVFTTSNGQWTEEEPIFIQFGSKLDESRLAFDGVTMAVSVTYTDEVLLYRRDVYTGLWAMVQKWT